MKPASTKVTRKDLQERGYVERDNCFYPPNSPQAELIVAQKAGKKKPGKKDEKRTGWIDDERNIRNKNLTREIFDRMIEMGLGVEIWNEFYFSTKKAYRFDKALPVSADGTVLKVALEINGGIWSKGNSGHSSGTGIKRDMDKSNLAQSLGWVVIHVEPSELNSLKTLELIKKAIGNRKA